MEPWFYPLLACPDCKGDFREENGTLRCVGCGFSVPVAVPLDLSPVSPKPMAIPFVRRDGDLSSALETFDVSAPPALYHGPLVPPQDLWPAMLFSQILLAKPNPPPPLAVLDLGVGRGKKECFDFLGCRYVGIDRSGATDITGDIHYLPFRDDQFDVIFSYMVLEHVYNPAMVLR